MEQADANDDSVIDQADQVYLIEWLYLGGSTPPPPGPYGTECATDTTGPPLGCEDINCD